MTIAANTNANSNIFTGFTMPKADTGKTDEKKTSELYLNVLFKLNDEYIPLTYGIGLDTIPNSKGPKALANKQDFIRDMLVKMAAKIKPGEGHVIVDNGSIQLEIRRKNAEEINELNNNNELAKAFMDMFL